MTMNDESSEQAGELPPQIEQNLLSWTCRHCYQKFQFPSELLNQEAECPHCKQQMVLAPPNIPNSGVNRKTPADFSVLWEWSACFVSLIAFILFLVTVFNAPWVTIGPTETLVRVSEPLFSPPHSYGGPSRLDLTTLVIEWAAILIAHVCLLYILKEVSRSLNGSQREKSFPNSAIVCAVLIGTLLVIATLHENALEQGKGVDALREEVHKQLNSIDGSLGDIDSNLEKMIAPRGFGGGGFGK